MERPLLIDQILEQLTGAERLPEEAIRAAEAQLEMAVPAFLRDIEDYLATDRPDRQAGGRMFFLFHMLGSWREKSAYRALARLLALAPDRVDSILGDGITTTSHRVMAAVFDGDPQPLFDLILDVKADEYVRSRMLEALAMVVLNGDLDRAVAARFLRDCFMNLHPQSRNFVWNGWQEAIAMLGLAELGSLVKKAFDRRFIDPHWIGFDAFRARMAKAGQDFDPADWQVRDEYTLFGDTIEELSTWYAFSDERWEKEETWEGPDDGFWEAAAPAVNPFKGVGRNDPCPCGSGKKFKKCCLN